MKNNTIERVEQAGNVIVLLFVLVVFVLLALLIYATVALSAVCLLNCNLQDEICNRYDMEVYKRYKDMVVCIDNELNTTRTQVHEDMVFKRVKNEHLEEGDLILLSLSSYSVVRWNK